MAGKPPNGCSNLTRWIRGPQAMERGNAIPNPGVLWRFGDGTESLLSNPTHRYEVTEPTTFTVTMMYYDMWFEAHMNSKDVTVTP